MSLNRENIECVKCKSGSVFHISLSDLQTSSFPKETICGIAVDTMDKDATLDETRISNGYLILENDELGYLPLCSNCEKTAFFIRNMDEIYKLIESKEFEKKFKEKSDLDLLELKGEEIGISKKIEALMEDEIQARTEKVIETLKEELDFVISKYLQEDD